MRRNRRKTIRMSLLMLILLLGIGFAALTANLKINGTVDVTSASWDVHFENVQITNGSVTANPAPTSDDTTTTEMSYTINFTKPGDFFEFTTDIVNDGTIDAMVDVVSNKTYSSNGTTEITLPTYLKSTVTYNDGVEILPNQLLAHDTSEKIKVRVEFKKDIEISDLPSSGDTSIVFKFIGDYKQADENAVPMKSWILPNNRTKNNLQVGDELCFRGECFNFLHYDGTNDEDIVMLAKYNLKVGNIYSSSGTKTGEYTSNDPGYGKQSSEARGWVNGETRYGTVAFSATNYWDDNGSPSSNYPGSYYPGPNYPTIYDSVNYKGEPGQNNYSVAYYVDAYKTLLTNNGTTIKNARLLTYDEATDSSIGCDASNRSCPTNGFITNTTFWLGSANYNRSVWDVYSGGDFYYVTFRYDRDIGVRPVVVISKANI